MTEPKRHGVLDTIGKIIIWLVIFYAGMVIIASHHIG